MKILVCLPDEGLAQRVFGYTVEVVKGTKFSGDVKNARDFELIKREVSGNPFSYDIFLLDAQDQDCWDIARIVRNQNFISSIIFLVDKSKRMPDIFLCRPSARITNLENKEQLKRALLWAFQEQARANPFFSVRNKEGIMRIPYRDILWFESRQRVVVLHSRKQEISFYSKLSEVYGTLPKWMFLRCHQSYVVNRNEICRIDKVQKCIYLNTGDSVEVSKSYYQDVVAFCDPEKTL